MIFSIGNIIAAGDTYRYRDELKVLKKNPSCRIVFDKEAHERLREIERDLANFSQLNSYGRLARFMFTMSDAMIVTAETTPKLYAYIDGICKQHNMKTPVVFVSRHKSVFNAFAAKLFMSSGAILLGQKVLLEASDKEIEGVVAHEIGHIKYNHVNKQIFLNLAASVAAGVTISHVAKDRPRYQKIDPSKKVLAYSIIGSMLAGLLIGKRFEQEADEFACKENGRADGLIAFFERLKNKENKVDSDFDEIRVLLDRQSSKLDFGDSFDLYMRYYIAKFGHNVDKAFLWLYHNTRLGAHPSHENRIKAAQRYL